jgi:predicted Rossmann fold nucleotide-binding protein DprA/Smf involved in DNA uptake
MDIVQELPSPWRSAVRDQSSVLDVTAPRLATTDEVSVLAALAADEPQHIEDVIVRCGMAPARVGATLLSLELGGRVRQLEGQRWVAVGARSRRA